MVPNQVFFFKDLKEQVSDVKQDLIQLEKENPSKDYSSLLEKSSNLESEIFHRTVSYEQFQQEWESYKIKIQIIENVLKKKEKITSKELSQHEQQIKNATTHFKNSLKILKLTDSKSLQGNHDKLSKQWQSFTKSSQIEKPEEWKLEDVTFAAIEQAFSDLNKYEIFKTFENEEEAQADTSDLQERIRRLKELLAALKSLEVQKNQEDLQNYATLFSNINKQLATLQRDLDNLTISRELLVDFDRKMRQILWRISALEEKLNLIKNVDDNCARKTIEVSLSITYHNI